MVSAAAYVLDEVLHFGKFWDRDTDEVRCGGVAQRPLLQRAARQLVQVGDLNEAPADEVASMFVACRGSS